VAASAAGVAAEEVDAAVVATLDDALAAVVAAGERRGLRVVSLGRSLYGEVAVHAAELAAQLRAVPRGAPTLVVAGGEPVLRVTGDGRGGRAQELALRVAQRIVGVEGVTLLAAGTDGIDGPTTAAGGFADGGTLARIAAAGLDVDRALERNDSHTALAAAGDLFVPGPTGTNVADVVVALVDGR
jgi:hydroxypyruvate reductase